MIDLSALVARFEGAVRACATGTPGGYRRWTRPGPGRGLEPNPYGCADAANLLYTLSRFPADAGERSAAVAALQSFQDPRSGFFRESTHHEIHVTAHCVAALELFEAPPAHELKGLAPLDESGALEAFLDSLAWRDDPWLASHRGAGIYAARLLAGTFHYLFNYEHTRRPHPHPAAFVDTCLAIFAAGNEWPLGRTVSFAEVDWVYCLARAMRQTEHRRGEAEKALRAFAADYIDFLTQLDWDTDEGGSDLHRLFGAACALAELQRAVPGLLRSPRPLRLVLDRRPFI